MVTASAGGTQLLPTEEKQLSTTNSMPQGPTGFSATVHPPGGPVADAHLVVCAGELDLSTSSILDDAVAGIAEGDVVIDMSEVAFMDSTGVSILVGSLQRLEARDSRLVVVCPAGVPRRVLALTGLESMLGACDSLQDAAALLARG
jgi:anti-sigma B factor antagonist